MHYPGVTGVYILVDMKSRVFPYGKTPGSLSCQRMIGIRGKLDDQTDLHKWSPLARQSCMWLTELRPLRHAEVWPLGDLSHEQGGRRA